MNPNPYDTLAPVASFILASTDFRDGAKLALPQVSGIFGAGGEDRSPELSWTGFPPETKSFVVTMFDPDAPTVSGFWHWAVVNIPANVNRLSAGAGDEAGSSLPSGALQLPNDARMARYLGAAPPHGHGPHRYIFCVNALDVEAIAIDKGATPAFLMANLFGRTLARALLTGQYER